MNKLFVIAGPSGAGKGTIINELLKKNNNFCVAVSHTSRPPRDGETINKEYYFVSRKEFEDLIKKEFFIEYALVHDNYYGTSKTELEKLLKSDKIILFDIDVQGALNIKKIYPQATLIFLQAPNKEILIARLKKRQTETESTLKKRLETMKNELPYALEFDYQVVNDKLDETISKIEEIIKRRNI